MQRAESKIEQELKSVEQVEQEQEFQRATLKLDREYLDEAMQTFAFTPKNSKQQELRSFNNQLLLLSLIEGLSQKLIDSVREKIETVIQQLDAIQSDTVKLPVYQLPEVMEQITNSSLENVGKYLDIVLGRVKAQVDASQRKHIPIFLAEKKVEENNKNNTTCFSFLSCGSSDVMGSEKKKMDVQPSPLGNKLTSASSLASSPLPESRNYNNRRFSQAPHRSNRFTFDKKPNNNKDVIRPHLQEKDLNNKTPSNNDRSGSISFAVASSRGIKRSSAAVDGSLELPGFMPSPLSSSASIKRPNNSLVESESPQASKRSSKRSSNNKSTGSRRGTGQSGGAHQLMLLPPPQQQQQSQQQQQPQQPQEQPQQQQSQQQQEQPQQQPQQPQQLPLPPQHHDFLPPLVIRREIKRRP